MTTQPNVNYYGFSAFSANIESSSTSGDHTQYVIKVTAANHTGIAGTSWYISKRFSDFDKLNSIIKTYNVPLSLPPKKIIGKFNQDFLSERQSGLQKYLNEILGDPLLCFSTPVTQFLYSSLPEFTSLALQYLSMEFRSDSQWDLGKAMPDIGFRFNKCYFALQRRAADPTPNPKQYCAVWHCFQRSYTAESKDLMKTLTSFATLKHSFILPMDHAVYNEKGVVIVREFSSLGSLSDGIHQKAPIKNQLVKSSRGAIDNGLQLQAIRVFGRQILEALQFLHSRNWYHGHLHVRNIILTSASSVALTDLENNLFHYQSMIRPILVEAKRQWTPEEIDIYCFGLCLYEMCMGQPPPMLNNIQAVHLPRSPDLRSILQLLITPDALKKPLPTAEILLKNEFFASVSLKMHSTESPSWKITSSCRKLMTARTEQCQTELRHDQQLLTVALRRAHAEDRLAEEKKARMRDARRKGRDGASTPTPKGTPTAEDSRKTITPSSNTTTTSSSSTTASTPSLGAPTPPAPPPPPPPPPPPAPVSKPNSAVANGEIKSAPPQRGALLGSISSFNKGGLRKAVTNDRSTPRV